MIWILLPQGATLAALVYLLRQCRRLYCQVARCRATLTDTPDTPDQAETRP